MTSQDTAPTTTGTGESATDSPVIRRDDPLGSIRAMAESHNNWGRWGQDDVLGTLNFIDADKRIEAAEKLTAYQALVAECQSPRFSNEATRLAAKIN